MLSGAWPRILRSRVRAFQPAVFCRQPAWFSPKSPFLLSVLSDELGVFLTSISLSKACASLCQQRDRSVKRAAVTLSSPFTNTIQKAEQVKACTKPSRVSVADSAGQRVGGRSCPAGTAELPAEVTVKWVSSPALFFVPFVTPGLGTCP